MNFNQY